jgi:hypothetical protein
MAFKICQCVCTDTKWQVDGENLQSMEAVSISETSINFYETTLCNIPEEVNLFWPYWEEAVVAGWTTSYDSC